MFTWVLDLFQWHRLTHASAQLVFSRARTCFYRAHTREQTEVVCTNSPPFRMLLNLNCLHEFLRRAKKRLKQKTSRRAINGLKDKFHLSKFTQIPFKIYTLENVLGDTTMTKPSRLLTASVFRRSSKKGFQTSSNSGKTSNTERLTLRLSVLGLWRIAESVRELRF